MINTELPPVGVKVNLRAVAPGSKSSILLTAQYYIILQNQVLQQTWEVKWLPLGTHRSTGWPTWQWKVLKFLGLWLLVFFFFFFFFALLGSLENDPLSSACLLSQIQVDQEITFRVLCDSSRALDLGSDDVSSRVELRLRPEELPRRRCLTAVELKTKSLCSQFPCSRSQSPGVAPGRSHPSPPASWGLWSGGCWWQMLFHWGVRRSWYCSQSLTQRLSRRS